MCGRQILCIFFYLGFVDKSCIPFFLQLSGHMGDVLFDSVRMIKNVHSCGNVDYNFIFRLVVSSMIDGLKHKKMFAHRIDGSEKLQKKYTYPRFF